MFVRKSFSFKDTYRTCDAPNRQYRRAMEKENQNAAASFTTESKLKIELYLKESKKLMTDINSAVQYRYADTAYDALTLLVDLSKEIGAIVFAQLCTQITFCLKEYRWPETLSFLQQLNSWYDNLVNELHNILLKRS